MKVKGKTKKQKLTNLVCTYRSDTKNVFLFVSKKQYTVVGSLKWVASKQVAILLKVFPFMRDL